MFKTTLLATALALTAGGASATVINAQVSDGSYCREYSQTMTIGGVTQKGHGTACLQPDGSWKIVSAAQPDNEVVTTQEVVTTEPNIVYVTQPDGVYMVPPEPFVTGDIFIGGSYHHFNHDTRPWHGGNGYGHGGWHH